MNITVSLDNQSYKRKPAKLDIAKISDRIAACPCSYDIQELACKIGGEGHTFCPAVFREGKRKADNFVEMQLFALDFDGGAAFGEIQNQAARYHLPIAFAYSTFSSTRKLAKFRVVFLNDVPVTDKHAAEIMIRMLLRIFNQADQSCADVSRMFFGGKGLIGHAGREAINIVGLMESFQRYIFETQPKNYKREVEQFAKVNQIACLNGCLQIHCVHRDGKVEDFSVNDQYIYGSVTVFPSNIPKYFLITHYQADVCEKLEKTSLSYGEIRKDFKVIEQKCHLYHDFIKEPHIHHNERFHLLTNLIYILGGCKRFQSIIAKKGYDVQEWRFYAKYVKDRRYKPQSCEGHCPYSDTCDHVVNIVNTVKQKGDIRKICKDETYYQVDEVYSFIENHLQDALAAPRKGICLIPAQTAVGKTEAYCKLISREIGRRFLIAVPTNQLKREVGKRLGEKGVEAEITLSLDEMNLEGRLKARIQFYYQIGLGEKVINLLRDYIKENRDTEEPEIMNTVNQCNMYLRGSDALAESRVLVTTHARLLTLSSDIIKQYTVIVDEDILSTIFKNIRTVSRQTVQKVFDSGECPVVLQERLGQVIGTPDKGYWKFDKSFSVGYLSDQELEELEVYDNVNEIAAASAFQMDGDMVHYFTPRTLKEGKYIILSATSDSGLYRRYFPGRFIKEYPYHKAEYRGRLKQLTAYTMSRQCIQDNRNRLEAFLGLLQSRYQMITFMKYEAELGNTNLHFGNAEGVDWLKGEDVIVMGTPHLSEFVYKLIGYHLGIEVQTDVLAVRRIQYKDYEFNFMTYKNEALKNLQIFFIGKELEQCVGRARLLRNDCTVLVLSNFPCEQAELIQDDYLETAEDGGLMKACSPGMAGKL